MALKSLTNLPKIVPTPCTPEQQERNWQAIEQNLGPIINNLKLVQEANGLPNQDPNIAIGGDSNSSDSVIIGKAYWAISLGDDPTDPNIFIAPSAGNNYIGMIKALPCEDSAGTNPILEPIWIKLPERLYHDVSLPAGAVFAWAKSASGEYVAVSDYTKSVIIFWGVAQTDSVDGDPGTVTVRRCDDADGNNPVAPNLSILLPKHNNSTTDIKAGDVIAYAEARDAVYVCISDYTASTPPPVIVRFELTASLVPGGTATAETVEWGGATFDKTGDIITVKDNDTPGRWRGVSGYRGLCFVPQDVVGPHEIIYMESIAEYVLVTTEEAMGETAANPSQDATVHSYWNGNDPGSSITVYNANSLWDYLPGQSKILCAYDWKNGEYFPVAAESRAFQVKAQYNWRTSNVVSCKLWSEGAEVGAAFDVKLCNLGSPSDAGYVHGCPNVIKGQVIWVMKTHTNEVVCIDSTAWDWPIGSVRLSTTAYNGTNPPYSGWAFMDGTSNATSYNGSGIDMRNYFPRGQVTKTDADTDTARGTSSHSHYITIDPSYANITVYDPDRSGDLGVETYPRHQEHIHTLQGCGKCEIYDPDGDPSDDNLYYLAAGGGATTNEHLTSTEKDDDYPYSTINLRHAVYDPGHVHEGQAVGESHIPPYKTLHYLERVDNSHDTMGSAP